MSAIPLAEVRVLDRNAEALGVSVASLMANAGRALADHVGERVEAGAPVTILVGPGNNGGDGLVAARILSERGIHVRVVTPLLDPASFKSPLARAAFDALPRSVEVLRTRDEDEVKAAASGSVVVDALLGAGIVGEPRAPFDAFVRAANASGARIIAVDVPTGLGSKLAVRASETLTFHSDKEGMTPAAAGRVTIADIGIPAEAGTHTGPGEMLLYPRAPRDQHKGMGGVVLIIGGGPYTGAPAIAGLAALRSGADMAVILTPRPAWPIIASYSPNLVVRPLNNDMMDFTDPSNRVALNQWLKKADVMLIGSGIGLSELAFKSTHHAVERALAEGVPVVADAEAIPALAAKPELVKRGVIVSAHAREFELITGEKVPPSSDLDGRAQVVAMAAKKRGATFVLKGPVDVIADAERVKFNATGHPAMSVAGTGDVLAGTIATLMAKRLSEFDAGRLGAYVTGRAGELAVETRSHGIVATDVVDALAYVLRAHDV